MILRGPNRRGFSLMEAIVALALLGLIVVLVLNIFPSTLYASQKASEQIEAENLAQSYLEEARLKPFSTLHLGAPLPLTPADAKFRVTQEFYQPVGTDEEQTRGIRIIVHWSNKGTERELKREVCNVRS